MTAIDMRHAENIGGDEAGLFTRGIYERADRL